MANVSFNEVQNYAKTHNIDFKAAAQKLGLSAQEAADLEKIGGDPGAPVDGYEARTYNYNGKICKKEKTVTLKSGRQVEVFKDIKTGERIFQYRAADGKVINEEHFLKQEGLTGNHFAINSKGQLVTVKNEQEGKSQEEKGFWEKAGDFVKDNAGGLAAGALVVGGGALCLTGVGTGVGAAMLIAGAGLGLTSCGEFEEEVQLPVPDNSNTVIVNLSIEQKNELNEAFQEGIDKLLQKMDELNLTVEKYGDMIVNLIVNNNDYLKQISEDLKLNGKQNEEIIEILTNINSTVQTIESLVEATNENIYVNGQNVNAKLEEILNAIKNGQNTSMEQINKYAQELKDLLKEVITNQKDNIELNEESNTTLDAILNKLNNMDFGSGEGISNDQFKQLLEILQSIESIGKDINNKLDEIIGKFDTAFPDNSKIEAALDDIKQYIKENNDKTDVTNNLLTQLLNKYQNGGISEEMLQKLLDAISKNGDKIDETNQLLAKMQNQDAEFQKNVLNILGNVGTDYSDVLNKILEATQGNSQKLTDITQLLAKMQSQDAEFQKNVLEALDKLGVNVSSQLNKILTAINNVSGGNSENLEALLNKVLEKMDSNTAAIIEAISNIKIEGGGSGGNVDLSSLEKMMSELIELTKNNNKVLTNIDAKIDLLNVTADAILSKLDESNKDHKVIIDILNAIKDNNCKGYDDTQLLKILDLITGKLDDILAAIKDHDVNVTVDVTGKVTCECNCGGNHEGILGDLEDVLG